VGGCTASNYRSISIEAHADLPEIAIEPTLLKAMIFYLPNDKPVFFGHYWLKGNPMIYRTMFVVLIIVWQKKGYLAAYRFENESKLENRK
jgi:hypothetical protein